MVTQVADRNINTSAPTTASDNMRYDTEGLTKPVKKNRHRSSSSLAGCSKNPNKEQSPKDVFRRSSSLSLYTDFVDSTTEATLRKSLEQVSDSSFCPFLSQKALQGEIEEERSLPILTSQRNGRGIPWQWSKIRKGIRARKVINLAGKGKSTVDGIDKKTVSKGKQLQDQGFSSEEDSRVEHHPLAQELWSHEEVQSCSSTSLSHKYQPKHFHDIAGHEIIIKALSNAVMKEKVAPLYLFHGPSGTGKTSVARIFAMALNCESSSHTKPCWSCRGCSRSLYIMELCSGSRISGFQRIRTLLQSTTFTQSLSGFKVFIIEECHSLTVEAWEEILDIAERGNGTKVVFVMITEDTNMIPRVISSRCQKFCFSKLKDTDITLKLATIVTRENIGIERDALKLVVYKAEGSMREAENIVEQLMLLGSRITSSMVQQIVGLVPHTKLLDLLTTVTSEDTINTVKSTRELITSGVQPQTLVSQLASLITVILSGAANADNSSSDDRLLRSGSQLTENRSQRLSHALKILVETEKQLSSSSDHTTWVVSALLQIASEQNSNKTSTSIVLPGDILIPSDEKFDARSRQNSIHRDRNKLSELVHHRKSTTYNHSSNRIPEQPDIDKNEQSTNTENMYKTKRCSSRTVGRELNLEQVGNMEEVWGNMLEKIQCEYVKEFLCQVKLASLTISSANAIVHLIFKRPEKKLAAQMSEATISEALQNAFGCPVTVNMSLEPMQVEISERAGVSTTKSQKTDCQHSRHQLGPTFLPASELPCSPNGGGVVMRRSKSQKSYAADNNLRHMRLQQVIQMSQSRENYPPRRQEASTTHPQQVLPFSGILTPGNKEDFSADPESDRSVSDRTPVRIRTPRDVTSISNDSKPKHRWVSVSSIQQGDASVEPYSQDLLFENENMDKEKIERRSLKLRKGLPKSKEDQHNTTRILNRSWSCTEIFCRETRVTAQHELNQNME